MKAIIQRGRKADLYESPIIGKYEFGYDRVNMSKYGSAYTPQSTYMGRVEIGEVYLRTPHFWYVM